MISIRKVAEPNDCWGNMAPYPVDHEGKTFRTTEALFLCLRFDDEGIIEAIRVQKSPMGANVVAKRHKARRGVEPMSPQVLENMRLCLRSKVEQHPGLALALLDTGDEHVVEDCTKRKWESGLSWGAALVDGEWRGENWLGVLWIEIRAALSSEDQ